mgnify:CR=1 FL=1
MRLAKIQRIGYYKPPHGFKNMQMLCGIYISQSWWKTSLPVYGDLVFHLNKSTIIPMEILIGVFHIRLSSNERLFCHVVCGIAENQNNLTLIIMNLLTHQSIYKNNICITFTQIFWAKVWENFWLFGQIPNGLSSNVYFL